MALFVLIITVIGFGATAIVGRAAIAGADPQGRTAYPLGSRAAFGADVPTGETFLFTMVTTALFLTLLAAVAGMILAGANTLAHDLFAPISRSTTVRREMTLARVSALTVGVPTVLLATLVQSITTCNRSCCCRSPSGHPHWRRRSSTASSSAATPAWACCSPSSAARSRPLSS